MLFCVHVAANTTFHFACCPTVHCPLTGLVFVCRLVQLTTVTCRPIPDIVYSMILIDALKLVGGSNDGDMVM